ncbi:hypothetical protein Pcinc_003898 [Petrolisthes cinctipes]|uniref:Uncharacterized protein n=1 Tax=Petrolisthes cinctipes TaxID=88211 RepID=A0AAE1GI92_PETCI|nr:hypothetical protein Pcinc_003898 [Petrolisthes cinctipes]
MAGKRERGNPDAPDAQRKARREDEATPPREDEDIRNSSRREECEVDDPRPPSQMLQMEVDKCEARISMIKQALPRTQQGMKPSAVARPAGDRGVQRWQPQQERKQKLQQAPPVLQEQEQERQQGPSVYTRAVRAVLGVPGVVKDTAAIEAAISETQTNRKPVMPAQSTPIKKSDREQSRMKLNLTNMVSLAQEEQPSLLEKGGDPDLSDDTETDIEVTSQ